MLKTFRGGPCFTSLRLHSVESLNHDTKRFRFALPDQNAVSGLGLASSVLTFCRPNGSFLPVIRPYTPVGDLDEPGFLELVIKQYPQGRASTHIHSLKPGEHLTFVGSMRAYSWKPNETPHAILIAGGAGITPMCQLIRGILKNPEETTKITLLYGVNSDPDALFQKEFAQYEEQFGDRFKVLYTVSRPSNNSPFLKGYVSQEMISSALAESEKGNAKIFVCGPPAFESSMLGSTSPFSRGQSGGILGQLGVAKGQIHKF